jgi:predicted metalloprotease
VKWQRKKGRKGRDVIDVRGDSPGSPGSGGGGLPIPGGVAGLGGGAGIVVLIVIVAISLLGGEDAGFDLGPAFGTGVQAPSAEQEAPLPPDQDPQRDLKDFSSYVFTDAQNKWSKLFKEDGDAYQRAELVLYDGAVSTGGCGSATSAVGPFYCPADQRVYLDLTFYEDMRRQLGAPGDFAWAYVIAHELGHHVQNLKGTEEEAAAGDQEGAESASVRLELQADCYAGVYGSTVFARDQLEEGDIEEAFGAAEAIGDDRLQRQAGQEVDPDSFTHGTSEQRRTWFDRGYDAGRPADCDTFSGEI